MLPHIRLNFQHSSPPSHTYTSPTWVLLFTFFYPSLLCYTPQGNSPPFPPPVGYFLSSLLIPPTGPFEKVDGALPSGAF